MGEIGQERISGPLSWRNSQASLLAAYAAACRDQAPVSAVARSGQGRGRAIERRHDTPGHDRADSPSAVAAPRRPRRGGRARRLRRLGAVPAGLHGVGIGAAAGAVGAARAADPGGGRDQFGGGRPARPPRSTGRRQRQRPAEPGRAPRPPTATSSRSRVRPTPRSARSSSPTRWPSSSSASPRGVSATTPTPRRPTSVEALRQQVARDQPPHHRPGQRGRSGADRGERRRPAPSSRGCAPRCRRP